MVGALVILLLLIGAFVAFRSFTREDLSVEPESVDYLEAVGLAQDAGWSVVYPAAVPSDWKATSVDSRTERQWGIGFLAPGGFAGVHQEDASTSDLLEQYVDAENTELSPVTAEGSVAPTWQAFRGDDGDLGYVAEVDGERVLVYGSAPESQLLTLLRSLTTKPVADS